MDTKRGLLLIGGLNLLVMTIGVVGATGVRQFLGLLSAEEAAEKLGPGFFGGGHMSFLSLAVAAIAVITFFGFLMLERKPGSVGSPNEGAMRRAITVAMVTVYLVLVGVMVFFRGTWESPEVTQTLLGSFTATIGVVVAFYFGSSAYLEARSPKSKGKH
jgi:peptidoglycan biosynthesis protein MviN/MurJ (putative lipid II flippase)